MKFHWALALAGLIALGTGCNNMHMGKEAKEEKEGEEVKITLDQVPAAARETLLKEANGAAISTVDREEKNGQTIYETDVMQGGQNYEIKVAADGKLISKKVDNEEAEKAEKKGEKEEDEKNEHK